MMHPSLLAWIGGVSIALWGFFASGDVSTILFGVALAAVGVVQMSRRSASKLNRLNRGMTLTELQAVLGTPAQKELKADKTVYKYSVFTFGSGWKPAYVIFGVDDRLSETFVDQAEYEREVDRWIIAFKEQRKREELAQRQFEH